MATTINAVTCGFRFLVTSYSPPLLAFRSRELFANCWSSSVLSRTELRIRRRRVLKAVGKGGAEEQDFTNIMAIDKLIDLLRTLNSREIEEVVAENILAFDTNFWLRLAARVDTCTSEDDEKDYEELANRVMGIVDNLVRKTNDKIESSTNVLMRILNPVLLEKDNSWPPRNPEALKLMEKEIEKAEKQGHLDEGFLSTVNAQLRRAKEDKEGPGVQAMLQKVLQIYASKILLKRTYAKTGEGEIVVREKFLESIIEAPESSWNKLLLDGLTIGKGEISPEDFCAVIKKRVSRVLISTENGSYQQRVLVEFLQEIENRTQEIVQVLQGGGGSTTQ